MSRIRSIKPEFWTAEQIMECSLNARALFIGLWNFADDSGRHPASLRTLKAEVLPGDMIPTEQVGQWVDELIANDLMIAYVVDGKEYWQVTGWHHQKINRPQPSKYPGPDQGTITERAVNGPCALYADPIRSDPIRSTTAATRPANKQLNGEYSQTFEEAWSSYPARLGGNPKRRAWKAWKARVATGATEADMLAGVERYAEFVKAQGKLGTEFVQQAATFFGPDEHFRERWVSTAPTDKPPPRTFPGLEAKA